MDPAMKSDLVTLGRHPALLVRIKKGSNRRHKKGCFGIVPRKRFKDPRHALAIAILTL
jgi:hypothetical protein